MAAAATAGPSGQSSVRHAAMFDAPGRPRPLARRLAIHNLHQEGLETFLTFLAFISLQLGILNLLPVPILDGGHIVILTVESVMGRDLSEQVKERAMQAGMFLLLAFFGAVLTFDVIKTRLFDVLKSLF